MNIHLIGIIKNNSGKLVGFRLLDIDSMQPKIMDADFDSVYNQVVGCGIKVHGITKSSFDTESYLDYPVIVSKKLIDNNRIVYLDFEDDKFTISNWHGLVRRVSKQDFIGLLNTFGVVNKDYLFYLEN